MMFHTVGRAIAPQTGVLPMTAMTFVRLPPVPFCFCHTASLSAGVTGGTEHKPQNLSGVPARFLFPAFTGISYDSLA